MLRSVFVVLAASVAAASAAAACDYPCPVPFAPNPICGMKLFGTDNLHHTFSSRCALECHAERNPDRAYLPISTEGQDCASLGYTEKRIRPDILSEFDFPYNAPGNAPVDDHLPSECSNPCPVSFVSTSICGRKLYGSEDLHHTFTSRCALNCHAAKHPDRGYFAIGEEGQNCADLGETEKRHRIDVPSEFDFPYELPTPSAPHPPRGRPSVADCSYPCPASFLPTPICGMQLSAAGELHHTFSSRCALDCHAAKNPLRAYLAISEQGTGCSALGYTEKHHRPDLPSEFDWPYDAPAPPVTARPAPDSPDCRYPCPASFAPTPICGQKLYGNEETHRTFSSRCALDCHAAKNPARAYYAVGRQGQNCGSLGYPESPYRADVPSEFDFPYEAPYSFA